jgi:hypothetical protein
VLSPFSKDVSPAHAAEDFWSGEQAALRAEFAFKI